MDKRIMIWRVFSTTMILLLGFLTLAEMYRYMTVGNTHMAIDTILCASMTAFWIHNREESIQKVGIDLSYGIAIIFLLFVGWVASQS